MLCLWLPNWPIQRLVVDRPELRRKRVVLFRRDSRRGQVVAAVSPLAIRDGVCVDMPLSEAKSLLRAGAPGADYRNAKSAQSPASSAGRKSAALAASLNCHIFEHEPAADFEAIKALADSLEAFSPIIGLETIDPAEFKRGRRPDAINLEVTGLAHLFGDEAELARQILKHCDELGYLPRIAIGDTVGIAWAVARYFAGQYFATHQQPVVLEPGDLEWVKQLPVEGLRLEAGTTETLYQLGIETIGQLQQLPRNDLAMRFGNLIHRRLDQLTGKLEEPVVARRKPAEFVAEQLLEYPTNHRETIEVIIARLVTGLCSQMRSLQRGALEWSIKLVQQSEQPGLAVNPDSAISQSNPPIEFRVNLFQPTANTKDVMPLVEMQLEQALSPHTRKFRKRCRSKNVCSTGFSRKPKEPENPEAFRLKAGLQTRPEAATTGGRGSRRAAEEQSVNNSKADDDSPIQELKLESQFHRYTTIEVQEILVSVTSDVLLVQQQRQLFDENPRLDRQSLAHLINRLASRLGTENVVYPSLQSGAQPEYSFRLKPLVDPNRKQRRRSSKPPKQSHMLARPLRLFRPAKRLDVIGVFPSESVEPNRAQVSANSLRDQAGGSPALLTLSPAPPDSINTSSQTTNFKSQKIIRSWGPERIETGWWRGLTVCRDYWRVETETRQHFWVYRDLRSGNWFLHGEF